VIVVSTVADVRREAAGSHTVGLVPTMGGLHAGHRALFEAARPACDVLVASSYVNAAQFAEEADFTAYPRDPAADAALAEAAGVDVLFAPTDDVMYPPGFATWVEPQGAALGLEGEYRPGHFRGVATVVLKLFTIVAPQIAWFGRKDAQQVAVVRQLVRDLELPIEIRVVDTVRDADGLALSSRNARLSAAERARALAIPRALATRDVAAARTVLAEAGIEPDYVTVAELVGPTLAIAATVGTTRLIDNVPLEEGALA
jgi:pantoate--beta-alanine ligase